MERSAPMCGNFELGFTLCLVAGSAGQGQRLQTCAVLYVEQRCASVQGDVWGV